MSRSARRLRHISGDARRRSALSTIVVEPVFARRDPHDQSSTCTAPRSSRLRSLAAPVAAGVAVARRHGVRVGFRFRCCRRPRRRRPSRRRPTLRPRSRPRSCRPRPNRRRSTTVPSPECNGLSAADVGAAAGARVRHGRGHQRRHRRVVPVLESTTGDSVVVLTESTATYLGGVLDGLPVDEALGELETTYTTSSDAPTVEPTTIGGFPGIVVTGTNAIIGTPVGYASTIVERRGGRGELRRRGPVSNARRLRADRHRGGRTRRGRSGVARHPVRAAAHRRWGPWSTLLAVVSCESRRPHCSDDDE